MTISLVLGGTRSGKSEYAEALATSLAAACGTAVTYVATASSEWGGAEFTDRISAHRVRRPADWQTVESGDLPAVLAGAGSGVVLIDDLGGWVSRRIGISGVAAEFAADLTALTAALGATVADVIIVSPEVGLAPVPATELGRAFADALGTANRAVSAVADDAVLIVAGRALELPEGVVSQSDSAVAISTTASDAAVSPIPDGPITNDSVVNLDEAESDATIPGPSVEDVLALFPTPEVFGRPAPPASVKADALAQLDTLTKPPGSLGRLEELAVWGAGVQNRVPARPFARPRLVVFAGDHGVADSGVSAYPAEVTAQMVENIAGGGAAINVLARQAGIGVRVVDAGVRIATSATVPGYKVVDGSANLARGDSLTAEQTRHALAVGRAIADAEIDAGTDLLIAGDLGIANTTIAAVLVGVLTNNEPVAVVGRGTGIDDAGWIAKTAAIRDGMVRGRKVARNPRRLLATVAGADVTAMAGFLAQAALRQTPVILDGVVVTSAALVANDLAIGAKDWWIAGHRSPEPAHSFALNFLGLTPILEMQMRLGEGTGAALAFPVLQTALAAASEMATFAGAGVSTAHAASPAAESPAAGSPATESPAASSPTAR